MLNVIMLSVVAPQFYANIVHSKAAFSLAFFTAFSSMKTLVTRTVGVLALAPWSFQ